jgi:hypothetical protein
MIQSIPDSGAQSPASNTKIESQNTLAYNESAINHVINNPLNKPNSKTASKTALMIKDMYNAGKESSPLRYANSTEEPKGENEQELDKAAPIERRHTVVDETSN